PEVKRSEPVRKREPTGSSCRQPTSSETGYGTSTWKESTIHAPRSPEGYDDRVGPFRPRRGSERERPAVPVDLPRSVAKDPLPKDARPGRTGNQHGDISHHEIAQCEARKQTLACDLYGGLEKRDRQQESIGIIRIEPDNRRRRQDGALRRSAVHKHPDRPRA